MSFLNQDAKNYANARKLRLIAESYFFYDKRRAVFYDMFGGGRLTIEKIDAWLATQGIHPGQNEIERALDYVFSPPPRIPGRFNESTFPACYTAKEEETCVAEVLYYLKLKGSKGFEYIIFSLSLSGRLVDLRQTIDAGRWKMPIDHDQCREIGAQVHRLGFDGVAAPSARRLGGNCCAVFVKEALRPGEIIAKGVLNA